MTHEEIEAAREQLSCIVYRFGNDDDARLLTALCEAAKAAQPENLAGRRAKIQNVTVVTVHYLNKISFASPLYLVEFGDRFEWLNRNQFELIEPTGEKRGDAQ